MFVPSAAKRGRHMIPTGFTVKWIEGLEANGSERWFWDVKQPGLGLRVNRKGERFFAVQYRVKDSGAQRRVALGRYGNVTLEEARERARRFVSAGRDGRDLQAARQQKVAVEAQRLTFDQLAAKWIQLHVEPKRSPQTLKDYKRIQRLYLTPSFGHRLIEVSTPEEVCSTLPEQ